MLILHVESKMYDIILLHIWGTAVISNFQFEIMSGDK